MVKQKKNWLKVMIFNLADKWKMAEYEIYRGRFHFFTTSLFTAIKNHYRSDLGYG